MQEHCEDFYHDYGSDEGCCLRCSDSEPGCLCKECNCKNCYWYLPPEEYDGISGHCEMGDILREEKKKEARKKIITQSWIGFKLTQKLKQENEKIRKPINNDWYSCQRCRRDFISEEEKIINLGKSPVCPVCEGKIRLTKEEILEIEEEVKKELERLEKEKDDR